MSKKSTQAVAEATAAVKATIQVRQPALSQALSIVSRATSPRTTLPVLSNILAAIEGGRLRLSATNLEVGISLVVDAVTTGEGAVTLPAKTWTEMVAALPNEEVTLTFTGPDAALKCAGTSAKIKGIDALNFPPMGIVTEGMKNVVFSADELKEALGQIVASASEDQARPALQGAHVIVKGNQVTFEATDGFRLTRRVIQLTEAVTVDFEALIPAAALELLAKVMGSEGNCTLQYPRMGNRVAFACGDLMVYAQLFDQKFPPLDQVIPRSRNTRVIAPTAALLKACKQAEVVARASNKMVWVEIEPGSETEPGRVRLMGISEETGEVETEMTAAIEGKPNKVAFNVVLFKELLTTIKTAQATLDVLTEKTPVVIRPQGNDDLLHVLMPMHMG